MSNFGICWYPVVPSMHIADSGCLTCFLVLDRVLGAIDEEVVRRDAELGALQVDQVVPMACNGNRLKFTNAASGRSCMH